MSASGMMPLFSQTPRPETTEKIEIAPARSDRRPRIIDRGTYDDAMKSHTEYLTFQVPSRMGFVNITPQCEEAVRKSGVSEGLLLCSAMHITASVFINDNESG